jgi:hypothetical protein
MHWDDDEAATRSFRRDDESPPRADRRRTDREEPRGFDDEEARARVIPLLRVPHAPATLPQAPLPSLRAHVEAQRGNPGYASHIEVSGGHVHIDIPAPPRPRALVSAHPPHDISARGWSDASDDAPPFAEHEPQPSELPAYESHIRPAVASLPPPPRARVAPRSRQDSPAYGVATRASQALVYAQPAPPPAAQTPQGWEAPQAPLRFAPPVDEYGPFARMQPRRARNSSNQAWFVATVLIVAVGGWLMRDLMRDALGSARGGTAIVPVSPLDANVSIDGQELAPQGGLFKLPDLAADRDHLVEVSHKGFVSETRRVRLNPGEVRVLPSIDLEPLPGADKASPPAAGASDSVHPQAAGAPVARAPTAGAHAAPKPSRVRVAAAARPIRSRPPEPRANDRAAEPPAPDADAMPRGPDGVLRINSLPWAEVTVDGRLIGTTPQQNIPLSPGRHKIRLVNPELGMSKGLVIRIAPGQTLTKSVSLID